MGTSPAFIRSPDSLQLLASVIPMPDCYHQKRGRGGKLLLQNSAEAINDSQSLFSKG